MAQSETSAKTETTGRHLGEKLFSWEDTANWPAATYKIGVVAYENLVIVRPPAPMEGRWVWYPDAPLELAKEEKERIESIRERAEEEADGGLLDSVTVRKVIQE